MKTIDRMITYFEDYITVLCFSLMSIITIAAVFFRYALSNPIIWSEEVSRYLMIWGICIGISIVTRNKAQLGIEVFSAMAPPKIKKALSLISQILLILTYAVILYLSISFIKGASKTGQLTPILRIPFFYIYLAMPVGFALSTYRAIQLFWREHFWKKECDSE